MNKKHEKLKSKVLFLKQHNLEKVHIISNATEKNKKKQNCYQMFNKYMCNIYVNNYLPFFKVNFASLNVELHFLYTRVTSGNVVVHIEFFESVTKLHHFQVC